MLSSNLPVASTTITLTPVRIPGSSPIVIFCPAGAASSRSLRLLPNTSIAASSACSRRRFFKSISRAVFNLIFQVHLTTSISHLSAALPWSSILKKRAILCSMVDSVPGAGSSSSSVEILKKPSLRPLNSARIRCEGICSSFSLVSK